MTIAMKLKQDRMQISMNNIRSSPTTRDCLHHLHEGCTATSSVVARFTAISFGEQGVSKQHKAIDVSIL
eukprot:scaffold8210_cov175-Amphora_coffeaeformis.AAC.8